MLRVFQVNSADEHSTDIRQLPPSIVEIEGRQAAFPLSLGHAVDYVSNRAVLIGYVLVLQKYSLKSLNLVRIR